MRPVEVTTRGVLRQVQVFANSSLCDTLFQLPPLVVNQLERSDHEL